MEVAEIGDDKPVASTSSDLGALAVISEKYNYNENNEGCKSTHAHATHANREMQRERDERAKKRKASSLSKSRGYKLTMVGMDTLQRVNDDIANDKINNKDIERAMPKKPRKKASREPRMLLKDAQKISDDVFAGMILQPLTKCCFCVKHFEDKNHKPYKDKQIGGHLIQCSHKAGHDLQYVKHQVSIKLNMIVNNRTLLEDAKEREFQRINGKGKKRKKVLSKLQSHSSTSKVISERLEDFLKKYDESETEDEYDKESPFLDSELGYIYSKPIGSGQKEQ